MCSLGEFEMHLFLSQSTSKGETDLLESFWRAGDGGRTKGMCMLCKTKHSSHLVNSHIALACESRLYTVQK